MHDNAAAFRATYADWRLIKGRKVVQVVLELPLEEADRAYTALGGMPNPAAETWCGIARLDPTKMEVPTSESLALPAAVPAPSPGVDDPAGTRTLAQLSGAYCSIEAFQKFLNERMPIGFGPVTDQERAAEAVRQICKVETRRDIKMNTPSGDRFEQLVDAFHKWELADRYVEAR